MNKKCPKCRLQYSANENYCTKCGWVLEKDDNRCSEMKTALCERRVYLDDDCFCAYCGARTTYEIERERLS